MASHPRSVDDLELEWTLSRPPLPHGPPADEEVENGPSGRRELRVDLTPFMNRAPLTIRADCSAARAHTIFRTLGLRHLVVVDGYNRAVGIITRSYVKGEHGALPCPSRSCSRCQVVALVRNALGARGWLKWGGQWKLLQQARVENILQHLRDSRPRALAGPRPDRKQLSYVTGGSP
eukprot:scaffold201_cov405-Prasinococcus_capsulatus_cf.AAC.57